MDEIVSPPTLNSVISRESSSTFTRFLNQLMDRQILGGLEASDIALDTTHHTTATHFDYEMDHFLFELFDDSLDDLFSSGVFILVINTALFLIIVLG